MDKLEDSRKSVEQIEGYRKGIEQTEGLKGFVVCSLEQKRCEANGGLQ